MSLIIPALLSRPAAAGGGGGIQALDVTNGGWIYTTEAGPLTDTNKIFIAVAFETWDSWANNSHCHLINIAGHKSQIYFPAYSGNPNKRLRFQMKTSGSATVVDWQTGIRFAPGIKHAVMFSYEDGVRAQLWVDGSADTAYSLTDNGGTIDLTDGFSVGIGPSDALPFNGRVSHIWVRQSSLAIDGALWSAHFDGGNNPIDASNGADLFWNWTSKNPAVGGLTMSDGATAPLGIGTW